MDNSYRVLGEHPIAAAGVTLYGNYTIKPMN